MAIDYGPMLKARGQEANRTGAYFLDDFGRRYHTEIDKRNLAPVGPVVPQFEAPLYVPPQYLTRRPDYPLRFFIDWDGWLGELRNARAQYDEATMVIAQDMFPNNYAQAMETPELFPALARKMGDPPLSERFVRAYRVKNPWITGDRPDMDPRQWFSDGELRALERLKAKTATYTAAEIMDDIDEFSGTLRAPHVEQDPLALYPEDASEFAVVAQAVGAISSREVAATAFQQAQRVQPQPTGQSYNAFVAEQRKQGKTLQEIGALWREQKAGRVPAGV